MLWQKPRNQTVKDKSSSHSRRQPTEAQDQAITNHLTQLIHDLFGNNLVEKRATPDNATKDDKDRAKCEAANA